MRVLIVLSLLLATACVPVGDIDGALVPTPTAQPPSEAADNGALASPEVVPASCPEVRVPEDVTVEVDPPTLRVRCGLVVLPEDRGDPTGPVVEVAFTQLGALPPPAESPAPDPLIVLADGPGDAMTEELLGWVDSSLRRERDVILLDNRGAGRSFPSLDCGVPPAPGDLPLDLVQDCRRDLDALGVGLASHDTAAMAADVVDVIDALGLESANLLGVGHGARIALEVLRDLPETLRAVVLDSPLPPEVDVYDTRAFNAQAALNRLFDECAQAPRCADAFGGLRERTEALIAQLDREAGAAEERLPTGGDLVRAALAAMRGIQGPPTVPAALALAEQDPAAALAVLREAAVAGATVPTSEFAEGLRLSSDCHDEVPFASPDLDVEALDAVGRAVAADVAGLLAACEIWAVPASGPEAAEPVIADVPALVLTGEFDPLSPSPWGAAVAARLPEGQVVQVDGAGHRVNDADNCTVAIVAEFLRRPTRSLNDACARDRVVDFVLP